jgi:hypothetical protein
VVSTLYGLYAPLAVVRSMSRNLTLVDLSLEPRIELQDHLASRLYGSMKDDAILAAHRARDYILSVRSRMANSARTQSADLLVAGPNDGTARGDARSHHCSLLCPSGRRLMGFGEFELLYEDVFNDADERRRKMLAAAANAMYRFRPPDRPVFWRMMFAQARIYQTLLRTKGHSFVVPFDAEGWQALLRLEGESDFDWREGAPAGRPLKETCAVTTEYLAHTVSGSWLAQHAAREAGD